jgi:hypothetical protein
MRRQQWRHYTLHGSVAQAALCFLLPLTAALALVRFRPRVGVAPALAVAVIALELVFPWTSTIPPPWEASAATLRPVWLPHFVLLSAIAALGVSVRRGGPAPAEG